jgi:hypothetical protein
MIYLIAHTNRKGRIQFVGRVYVNRDDAQQKLNEYIAGADGKRYRASDFSMRQFNTFAEAGVWKDGKHQQGDQA